MQLSTMKKRYFIICVLLSALVSFASVGDEVELAGLKYKITSEDEHTVMLSGRVAQPTSVDIPASIDIAGTHYSVTKLGYGALSYAFDLKSVVIPSTVEIIEGLAFKECYSLEEVAIPESVTEIGWGAFSDCRSLKKAVLPNSIVSMESHVFAGCGALTDVNIPKLLNKIEDSTFYNCKALANLEIPDNIEIIGEWAFYGCSSFKNISIPASVTQIGKYAFYRCTNLSRVTVPDNVTEIGQSAFDYCSSLKSITLGRSVSKFEIQKFYQCPLLESIDVVAGNSSFCSVDGVLFNADKTKLLTCPEGKQAKSYDVPATVVEISDYAFLNCTHLAEMAMSSSVKRIGKYGFTYCESLERIELSPSLENISEHTFLGCSSLKEIAIPSNVTSIGYGAFDECTSLSSVSIPASVSAIACRAFRNTPISDMTIPASTVLIEYGAFEGCGFLEIIDVDPANPEYSSLDGVLFNTDKTVLHSYPAGRIDDSYAVPSTVTQIGDYAFAFNASLSKIDLPYALAEIGYSAFQGCRALQNVAIPSSVTKIGSWAFAYNTALKEIVIPDNIKEIAGAAFAESGVEKVIIGKSVTTIGNAAFQNCAGLKNIYLLSSGAPKVYNMAFANTPEDMVVYVIKGSIDSYRTSYYWLATKISDFREMYAVDIEFNEGMLTLDAGKTASITATIIKDHEAVITSEEWSTSDSAVATVDNGLVTAVAPGTATIMLTLIDGYGIAHACSCMVTVSDPSCIDAVSIDNVYTPVELYDLNGRPVDNVAPKPGLYIRRQGRLVEKVLIR